MLTRYLKYELKPVVRVRPIYAHLNRPHEIPFFAKQSSKLWTRKDIRKVYNQLARMHDAAS